MNGDVLPVNGLAHQGYIANDKGANMDNNTIIGQAMANHAQAKALQNQQMQQHQDGLAAKMAAQQVQTPGALSIADQVRLGLVTPQQAREQSMYNEAFPLPNGRPNDNTYIR